MTEAERRRDNAICDRLMREGIQGFPEPEQASRVSQLAYLSAGLDRKEGIECALNWFEALENGGIQGGLRAALDYDWANAIAVKRYGTRWQWEQPTLAKEIFHLRRAISNASFEEMAVAFRCQCLNNLGNRLRVAGRYIEAIECWERVLQLEPNFGMALCNRALFLPEYAYALEDVVTRDLFYWVAHREATAALAPTAVYTKPDRDLGTLEKVKERKEWIESFLKIEEISAVNPFEYEDNSATDEERDYRRWCFDRRLFLGPLNDLGKYSTGTTDSLGLAAHLVPLDSPYIFASFFDQMEQEYVSARWMLYQGVVQRQPHFSDKDVFLQTTEPRPSLCLAVEYVKVAYRMAYSIFDKISFFINVYMALGIPERKVSFRALWQTDKGKLLRKEFDTANNWAFCGLYWVGKDFFEKANDDVAEPEARGLSEIRNYLEHKYLRVTVGDSPVAPPDDLAFMVSRREFEAKALHLLKLARCALIYLTIGVGFEERRREPARAGVPLEDIPETPYLADSEKC